MTIGQASAILLLNSMIKWSLLAMIIVLIVAIVQYTVMQPWWKDPIGLMIVLLEIFLLAEVLPQEWGQWFVHTVSGMITVGFISVGLSMLVTLGLAARIAVWAIEWRRVRRRRAATIAEVTQPSPTIES